MAKPTVNQPAIAQFVKAENRHEKHTASIKLLTNGGKQPAPRLERSSAGDIHGEDDHLKTPTSPIKKGEEEKKT